MWCALLLGPVLTFNGIRDNYNRSAIWCGSIMFVLMAYPVFYANRFLNKLVAWRKANPPKMRQKIAAYPHGFVAYEPACEQKLKCFANQDDLDQFIGHDGKALQDWKPDDRIVDAKGREYRVVPSGKKRYDLEPTGATWAWESMLEIAMADAKLVQKDPDAIRRRVTDAPAERRLPVLMKCIDEQALGRSSWSVAVVLILFLVVFFFVVYFGFGWVVALIGKWWMALHSRH
jgi:hypothetical protein